METKILIMIVLCALLKEGDSEPDQAINQEVSGNRWPRIHSNFAGSVDSKYLERLAALDSDKSFRQKSSALRKKPSRNKISTKVDNLNIQQEMMAHALIDSLNEAFKDGDDKDMHPEDIKDIRKGKSLPGGTDAIIDDGVERGFEHEGPFRDPFPPARMPRKAGYQEDEGYEMLPRRKPFEDDELEYKGSQPFVPRKFVDDDAIRHLRKSSVGADEDVDEEPRLMGPPVPQMPRSSPYFHFPSFQIRRRKSPDIPVHCIRSAPSTIDCSHGNFSYSLTLPDSLITQESVENLVSALCSIIETEDSPGGLIALNVHESLASKGKKNFEFGVKREASYQN